ncbi:ML domain-containing protein [Kitasatospora sp. NPDC002965]|uniref:ML domain-containing protein n=1 Tax=Kitasatospora sp. NPDC002965 TaxID=3154775 RepID=UPI0033B0E763
MTVWNSTGPADNDFRVDQVTLAPETPAKGEDIAVTLTGTLEREITGGTFDVTVKYGNITIHKDSASLAPAAPGPYTVAAQVSSTTKDVPSGDYHAHAVVLDHNGTELAGVAITYPLS